MSDEKPNWLWQAGFDAGQLRVKELERENNQLHSALKRLWEEDEMGFIISETGVECVKCGEEALTSKDIKHGDGCVQGYIYEALAIPSVQAALKKK